MLWTLNCLSVLLLCIFCAGIVIPQILLIAFRRRLFDMPDERKIHQGVVPRLGGIAFKPVVFFSFALVLGINLLLGHTEILEEAERNASTLTFGFCTIMILYLTGMADDLVGVRYRAKFVIQILCGLMLIAGGIWIDNLDGVLGIHALPAFIGYPLTVLSVVFLINAINLIDGIDGLASGLCSIALLVYGIMFFHCGQYIYAMFSFATLGVLIPFYYYNVFGNPEKQRKIFMGDTGSLTVGMMLALLGFKLLSLEPSESGVDDSFLMVCFFSPLLIPCCDVVRVYLHRVRNGRNPFLPDKNHIHHKLLAIGMKQRTAMVTIILVSLLFTLSNLLLLQFLNINWILFGDFFIWTIANIWLTKKIKAINNEKLKIKNSPQRMQRFTEGKN